MNVDVVSPYDPLTSQSQVLTTLRIPLTQFGTASGAYTLPEDAPPGTYILRPHEAKYQETYFTVSEYRKPEIDLEVTLGQENLLFGRMCLLR